MFRPSKKNGILPKYFLDPIQKKWRKKLTQKICATIRIGQEIQCLPYAGFFMSLHTFPKKQYKYPCHGTHGSPMMGPMSWDLPIRQFLDTTPWFLDDNIHTVHFKLNHVSFKFKQHILYESPSLNRLQTRRPASRCQGSRFTVHEYTHSL